MIFFSRYIDTVTSKKILWPSRNTVFPMEYFVQVVMWVVSKRHLSYQKSFQSCILLSFGSNNPHNHLYKIPLDAMHCGKASSMLSHNCQRNIYTILTDNLQQTFKFTFIYNWIYPYLQSSLLPEFNIFLQHLTYTLFNLSKVSTN